MKFIFIYITCKDDAEARTIASAVVGERLAACANVMAPHQSFFWWDGDVQSGQEVAVVFKTRADLFERLRDRVVGLHSYDTPCIVALPIESGYEPYLRWLGAETAI